MVKAQIGDIVEVVWKDAFCETCKARDEIDSPEPGDLLVLTSTYGIYYKDDNEAIMILQEKSDIAVDRTIIPKTWIQSINKLSVA